MKIVFCKGGDQQAPAIAQAAGVYYGHRNDYKGYAAPYMLDWNFKAMFTPLRWKRYLNAIEQHKPEIALVPDYFKGTPRQRMLQLLHEVEQAGAGQAVVCPKFAGAVGDVPNHVMIGISVPTKYAGFLPAAHEVAGRKLHLLGGHPDQQLYIMRYLYPTAEIVSVDANIAGFKAVYGQYWCNLTGNWKHTPKKTVSDFDLAVRTLIATRDYFADPDAPIIMRQRVKYCQPRLL